MGHSARVLTGSSTGQTASCSKLVGSSEGQRRSAALSSSASLRVSATMTTLLKWLSSMQGAFLSHKHLNVCSTEQELGAQAVVGFLPQTRAGCTGCSRVSSPNKSWVAQAVVGFLPQTRAGCTGCSRVPSPNKSWVPSPNKSWVHRL